MNSRGLCPGVLRAVLVGLISTSAPVAAQALTISPSATTPQRADSDKSAVELGVRFRSDVARTISGIRFYKYARNTGVHIGTLWTDSGAKLATATFTGETSSGWQQVLFASPVIIAAGTTYVASYHTNVGRYGASDSYFATAGYDRAPLHALRSGVDGANGVYRYGSASAFSDQTFQSANYPFAIDTLLDKALGAEGYYGAFTANMQADSVYSLGSDQIVASAKAHGVPVIAARQLLDWVDGRNGSWFQALAWNGTSLTFSIAVGVNANGLQAMLPAAVAAGTLTTLTLNGNPVAFTKQTIKGIEYALFQVAPGTYRATYAP